MTLQPKIYITLLVAYISIHISAINATHGHIKLSSNYLLDYKIINDTIGFNIEVKDVTGWVGIGLNANGSDMIGADIYMGGYNQTGLKGYGDNFFGVGNTKPEVNPGRYWYTANVNEVNGTTRIRVVRWLKLYGDERHVSIQDKNIHLLWAYNMDSDDIGKIHSKKGSIKINFYNDKQPSSPSAATPSLSSSHNGINRVQCGFTTSVFLMTVTICSMQSF